MTEGKTGPRGRAPVCLCVQSAVVAGHVGANAATAALGACGVEVWPLPTVSLSNHAAAPGMRGRRLPAEEIAALGEGLAASGALSRCDALLTGYLGSAGAALAVAAIAQALRAARPDAAFLCDPVLGDDGKGLYLPAEVGEIIRERLLKLADIAAPNLFELGWLTGAEPRGMAQTIAAARALGPATVFVTSAPAAPDESAILAVTAETAHLARAPRAPLHVNGAGDFVSALLLAETLRGRPPAEAAERAAAAASALALEAAALGRDDLPLAGWRSG